MKKQGIQTKFPALFAPFSNYFCFSVYADDFIYHVESGFYAFRVDASCVDPLACYLFYLKH